MKIWAVKDEYEGGVVGYYSTYEKANAAMNQYVEEVGDGYHSAEELEVVLEEINVQ